MNKKIRILLGVLALARNCSCATYSTPQTLSSSIYSPVHSAPYIKAPLKPAPIYEEHTSSAASSQETGVNAGSQTTINTHNLIYPAFTNFQAHISDLSHSTDSDQTVGASIAYSPYTFSSPLTGSKISIPVTYTTHTHSIPFETHTPQLVTKTSGSTYNSHTPIKQNEAIKTTITYAEAPEVSHTTFTGYGTTYSW